MSGRMHRTQILIEPEQHKALSDLAEAERKSISELIREILREYFYGRSGEARWRNRDKTLQRARKVRNSILDERDGKPIDLDMITVLEEIRETRDVGFLSALGENDDENRD